MKSKTPERLAPTKQQRFLLRLKRQLPYQAMVIPGMIFLLIFSFYPLYGLIIAFKRYTVIDTISTAPWVGWDNFLIVLKDKYFWGAVYNTLAISLLKLAIGFVVPIILAVMIFELRPGPFKRIIQTISYLPHFLSWIILGGMITTWLSTTGMLPQILVKLGVLDQPVNYLLKKEAYWWIAVLSDTWKEAGWGTILYLAAMSGIDPSYYEAATIDGAGRFRRIFSITLPLIRHVISINLILTVAGLFGSNLDQTMVLMNTQNRATSEVISYYVYRMGMVQGDFSYATTVGLGISIVSVILLTISNKVTSKLNDESVF